MIITRLMGGLGNQLFQYAAARALAVKHGTAVKLDISAFTGNRLRSYALGHFHIAATVLTEAERRRLRIAPARPGLAGALGRLFASHANMPTIREGSFGFDARLLDAPAMCYLQGYWQSPKYFGEVSELIRRELTVREPPSAENQRLADRITASAAVSLHVRRGDYAANPATRNYHGTCGVDYYHAAEELLRSRVGDISLFVFSDDPNWAQANLRLRLPATFIGHNGPGRHYEDLRLMSLCRHHIIANSTFSWWGAWRCNHPDKIVIAPRNWFREAQHSTEDLIPETWIRL